MDYASPLLPFVQPEQPLPRQFVGPTPGTYNTNLGGDEAAFRSWVAANRVPFDVNAPSSDYDMRGFWQAFGAGDPRAASAVDPNDARMHYPDFWKTPSHATFSDQSKWATPGAPQWTKDDKLVAPSGRVLFDDRTRGGRSLDNILGGYVQAAPENWNATTMAQVPPVMTGVFRPSNQAAWEDAVANMPVSKNVDDRRQDDDATKLTRWANAQLGHVLPEPDISPNQRVQEGFSMYGSPLARAAGIDDVDHPRSAGRKRIGVQPVILAPGQEMPRRLQVSPTLGDILGER